MAYDDFELMMENILDHYKNPRNYGDLKEPDARAKDSNPLCGDVVEISVKFDGKEKIRDIRFKGKGCAISQASASMLTELVKGKDLEDVIKLSKDDILGMLGMELGPVRIKCALLSLKVLKTAVYGYMGMKIEQDED